MENAVQNISFSAYWDAKISYGCLIDVRSPGEYEKGHIPGAINVPLFSDEERKVIGTLYKEEGKEKAVLKGFEFIEGRLVDLINQGKYHSKGMPIAVHCWRGGMRSESMAWLWNRAGSKVSVLVGGYKAYRLKARMAFSKGFDSMLILNGKTGSGKTQILHDLEQYGEQVIDLEGLANHRGSAFGAIDMPKQVSPEQFENDLYERWLQIDPKKRVWFENESKSIGRNYLPDTYWENTVNANLITIDRPLDKRLDVIVNMYGSADQEDLKQSFQSISKRLGGQHVKRAMELLDQGDLKRAAQLALGYYDKAYAKATSKRTFKSEHMVRFEEENENQIAKKLIEYVDSLMSDENAWRLTTEKPDGEGRIFFT